MKLIIFGGTSEGRELAEWAAGNGFSVILCVATDYGEAVCTPCRDLKIRKGRMDADEMSALFLKECPQVIIDATHPHAAVVSGNIRAAAEEQGTELIRVIRPEAASLHDAGYDAWENDSVFTAANAAEAVEYLRQDDRPILLTTGSKELAEFSSLPNFSERVYARVLPQPNAISACEKAGLSGRHIIAMQGPFPADMNLALINMVGAGWLVTKESGERGGFPEKMEAAARSDIRVVVIRRPMQEDGMSLDEAEKRLLQMRDEAEEREKENEPAAASIGENTEYRDDDTGQADITLIGLGMGGGSQLTIEAQEALQCASVIFGAERIIEDLRPYAGDVPLVAMYRSGEICSYLDEHPGIRKACVAFSGDTGFFSGCAGFLKGSGRRRIRILPGISSFSCLCARFGLREEEFTPASLHGRDADIAGLLSDNGKVFLLLDPKNTIGTVCRTLTESGYGDSFIYAGIRLGYPDEELLYGKAEDFTERGQDSLAVMAVERVYTGDGTKGEKRSHA